jgi:hypothetical protein
MQSTECFWGGEERRAGYNKKRSKEKTQGKTRDGAQVAGGETRESERAAVSSSIYNRKRVQLEARVAGPPELFMT